MAKTAARKLRTSGVAASPTQRVGAQPSHVRVLHVCAVATLILLTAVVHGRALWNGFVDYDDNLYVTDNHRVLEGLTVDNLVWVATATQPANWHPLTLLSHMLDVTLFGQHAWGHHLTGVVLHLCNVTLLLVFLRRATNRFWPSYSVAALFALHPIHVESIGWVSERKDVLSMFFGLLTLLTWLGFVRRGGGWRYLLACTLFTLGLMSKPMLVTLPCVLFLLDWWPLQRLGIVSYRRLVLEKAPLFVLAAASSIVTFLVQQSQGAMAQTAVLPLGIRAGHALVSYLKYLGALVWPVNLAVFYPHPRSVDTASATLSAAVLILVTIAAFLQRHRRPQIIVGWLWFLGTLVPVIGLVQVGQQAMADRYAYLPFLGLYIAMVYSLAEVSGLGRYGTWACASTGIALTLLLSARAWSQQGYWKDKFTLFSHALAVTRDNFVAHHMVATTLAKQQRLEEAEQHLRIALEIMPEYADAHDVLGVLLGARQLFAEAEAHFKRAIELSPNSADAHANCGRALALQRRWPEAVSELTIALSIRPDHAMAHSQLGQTLGAQGQFDAALVHLTEAVRLAPDDATARKYLAITLHNLGRIDEAIAHYEVAVPMQPDDVNLLMTLAWLRSTSVNAGRRNGVEAVRLAEHANDLSHGQDAGVLNVLAAAYAEAGRFDDAARTQQQAVDLARAAGQPSVADEFATRVDQYRGGQPYRALR